MKETKIRVVEKSGKSKKVVRFGQVWSGLVRLWADCSVLRPPPAVLPAFFFWFICIHQLRLLCTHLLTMPGGHPSHYGNPTRPPISKVEKNFLAGASSRPGNKSGQPVR